MKIVKIFGGLGNQMFQYSYALLLKEQGYKVEIDTTYFDKTSNKYMLKYFDISIPITTSRLRLLTYNMLSIFTNKIFSRSYGSYKIGYWQNIKYLPRKKTLNKEFNFKIYFSKYCLDVLKKIEKSNSVSVHVRRGDYLNKINSRIYNNLDAKYYNDSFKLMDSKLNNPFYFVFSNDIDWAKKSIQNDNVFFVENKCLNNDIEDFFLMTSCKHNIIANSTFSWWAAFMNCNKSKLIVMPEKWFCNKNEFKNFDYFLENSVRL